MTNREIIEAINHLYGCDFKDLDVALVFMQEIKDKSDKLEQGCYRTPQCKPCE